MRSKIKRCAPLAAVAMTVAFLACEESPTSIEPLADANTAPQLSADAGNPVVRSALGSAHAQTEGNPKFAESGWRVLTFNASQRQDGTTTGNVKYDTHDRGDPAVTHRVQGRVICMAELGNGMIVIGAEGTQRTPYDDPPVFAPFGTQLLPAAVLPGDWGMFFVVRDNGEGAAASGPDQFTGIVHTNRLSVAQLCALGADHPLAGLAGGFLNDAEAGNIQVSW
ncbi:MAG: hypothetical protein ACWGON_06515 [Gemmatimonadota bacterium]